jgi:hypothetical protein
MAIKVKELKDDAIIEIKVNKNFYLMAKAVLLYILNSVTVSDKDAYIKETITKEYKDLDDAQRSFYTIALLLAEVETQANNKKLFSEKEVLEPGDEGYVEPKLG